MGQDHPKNALFVQFSIQTSVQDNSTDARSQTQEPLSEDSAMFTDLVIATHLIQGLFLFFSGRGRQVDPRTC